MAKITKIYTKDQFYQIYQLYLLSKPNAPTDFNEGSKVSAILEALAAIISSTGMDFKEAIVKAIPVALYEGLGFSRLAATYAIGFLRLYRKPIFTLNYNGAGTVAAVTSSSTNISAVVTGAPGDNFSFDYSSYPTATDLVTAIDSETNWTATLIQLGATNSADLFQYAAVDVLLERNFLNNDGMDIMLASAGAVSIPTGFSVSVENLQILTTADGTLLAGDSSVIIAASVQTTGVTGNILLNAIDTRNGKGAINSSIQGVEHVINDSAFSGGAAEETDEARRIRFSETVNSLNAGTEAGIISAMKSISGVRNASMRTAYPFKGANSIILDDGSGTISAALLAEAEKVLYGDPSDLLNFPGKGCAGISYLFVTPSIIPVNVHVTVYRLPSLNVNMTSIAVSVQSAIEQYINTRSLGQDVLLSEIIRVSKNSNAAVYDIVISIPTANVPIEPDQVARTGAGTGATVVVTPVVATVL